MRANKARKKREGSGRMGRRGGGGSAGPGRARPAGGGGQAPRSLDGPGRRVRLKLDLAERGFVLVDVLLEDVEQRLGLLRAEVNSLEILDIDVIGRGLVDQAEEQEEVPEIYTDLDAVGVALPVFRHVAH